MDKKKTDNKISEQEKQQSVIEIKESLIDTSPHSKEEEILDEYEIELEFEQEEEHKTHKEE